MTTEELLKEYEIATKDSHRERALWNLLKGYESSIEGLIEDDPTGSRFIKSFRQNDITGNSHVDMAMWMLLNDAPIFWNIINSFFETQKVVEEFEQKLEKSVKNQDFYYLFIKGRYTERTCKKVEQIYLGKGWAKVSCHSNSKDWKKSAMTHLLLWRV